MNYSGIENYLYFSKGTTAGGGSGANASTECAMYPVSLFTGVAPITTTTTRVYFESPINDVDSGGGAGDYIEITHANTTATTGHRCQIIAKALAQACNAGPHATGAVVDVLDFDNSIFFGGLEDIKNDASFGLTITLDS
tara:strand:+ start:964 stop:1380 length:417 start_codon:yes stop_codon:yes gene_type:complete